MRKKYEVLAPGTTTAIGKLTFDDEQGTAGLQLDQLSVGGVPVSGEQRVRLLGPYTIAHDTPNIASQVDLVELEAGTLVIAAWPEITTAFGGGAQIGISLADASYNAFYGYADAELEGMSAVPDITSLALFSGSYTRPFRVRATKQLYVWVDSAGAQGAANIYALIAEPAE